MVKNSNGRTRPPSRTESDGRARLSSPECRYVPCGAWVDADGHDDLATLLLADVEVDVLGSLDVDGTGVDVARPAVAERDVPWPVGRGRQKLTPEPLLDRRLHAPLLCSLRGQVPLEITQH